MSWRTKINGHEWLGNNGMYDEIADELVRQGCDDPRTGDSIYHFEVKDLDGLVKATEKVVVRLFSEDRSLADFSKDLDFYIEMYKDPKMMGPLTLNLKDIVYYAYIFISVSLLDYVGEINKDYTIHLVDGEFHYDLTETGKCIFEWW